MKDADAQASSYLDGIEKDLYAMRVISVTKRVVRGLPDIAIVDMAQQLPGILVAMTTHGRSVSVIGFSALSPAEWFAVPGIRCSSSGRSKNLRPRIGDAPDRWR